MRKLFICLLVLLSQSLYAQDTKKDSSSKRFDELAEASGFYLTAHKWVSEDGEFTFEFKTNNTGNIMRKEEQVTWLLPFAWDRSDKNLNVTITPSGLGFKVNADYLTGKPDGTKREVQRYALEKLGQLKQDENLESWCSDFIGSQILQMDSEYLITADKGSDEKKMLLSDYFYKKYFVHESGEDKTSKKPTIFADPDENPDKIYDYAEEDPEYPGGEREFYVYLSKNINYPPRCQQQGIAGRVQVTFVVEKDGSISDITVKDSVHPDLDKEAVRLVSKMPKWKPGKVKGKPVRVGYQLPISFSLYQM